LLEKKFQKFNNNYNIYVCENGLKALELIKNNQFSIVVSDLQMPQLDGFGLLSTLRKNYPDIFVIIITAFDKPKTKDVLLKAGATGFFTKPLKIEHLSSAIDDYIAREVNGGSLKNASLEMFIQLVEMEAKSCTIRVTDDKTNDSGVLFFKDGCLIAARYRNLLGNQAAYKIFSWDKGSINIQNDCMASEKNIEGELQAILLEAMRLKDEKGYSEEDFDDESGNDGSNAEPSAAHIIEKPVNKVVKHETEKSELLKSWEAEDDSEKPSNGRISLKDRILNVINETNGLKAVSVDLSWKKFNNQIQLFGNFFGSGKLKCSYMSSGKDEDLVIFAGDYTDTVITVNSKCPREKLLRDAKDW
jgi:CheY-like chemotaxis protein